LEGHFFIVKEGFLNKLLKKLGGVIEGWVRLGALGVVGGWLGVVGCGHSLQVTRGRFNAQRLKLAFRHRVRTRH